MPQKRETRPLGAAGFRKSSCLAADISDNNPNRFSRQARMVNFEAVNRAAAAALSAILGRLLPGGKIVASEYVVRNPKRADRRPGSFKINTRSGAWADFATGDKGGDPVSLVAYLESVSQLEAARLLARMIGVNVEGRR